MIMQLVFYKHGQSISPIFWKRTGARCFCPAWKRVIEATGSGGIYPFVWRKDYDIKVQFGERVAMFAIWNR